LIAASEDQISEARVRLARVGIENLDGYLNGGVEAWQRAGFFLASTPQLTVQQLDEQLRSDHIQVLDVRREPEWEAGHIECATWWPLDNFKVSPPEIDHSARLAVHCKSGYRSILACSLLQRAGYTNVLNLTGGLDAWQNAKLPVVNEPVAK